MFRTLMILISLFILLRCAVYGVYFLSSEYRVETLEGEENERIFLRNKGAVDIDDGKGAAVTVLYHPHEKKESYTWHVRADSEVGFGFLAGLYYVQCGSGLLTGRMKPYFPDPFAEEKDSEYKSVLSPTVSGYPAYSYNGLGLTYLSKDVALLKECIIFGSHSLRYRAYENAQTCDASYSTLLGHTDREGSYRDPVFARSLGASAVFTPMPVFRVQISSAYYDIISESGKHILWSYDDTGGCKNTSGISVYGAYNDGVVSAYSEYVYNRQVWIDVAQSKKVRSHAWQGKAAISAERCMISAAGKKIGNDFYLPYSTPMGRRGPSESFVFDSALMPYKLFAFRLYASSDKNTYVASYTPEKTPQCKESIRLDIKPQDMGLVYFSARSIGSSFTESQKKQMRTGLESRSGSMVKCTTDYTWQEKESQHSHSLRAGLLFKTDFYLNGSFMVGKTWIKKDNDMVEDSVALDSSGTSWMSVRESVWTVSARLGFISKNISAAVRYAAHYADKHAIYTRFECSASGQW